MKRLCAKSVAAVGLLYAITLFAAQPLNHPIRSGPQPPTSSASEPSAMRIRMTVGGRSVTATLIDSPTTRDFVSLLPLTLKLEDYVGTEKIAYLPRKLSEEGAPAGFDPAVGDITYYAPWGNLALFYKDFGYAKGLIKLGHIDDGVAVFDVSGSVTVTIESPRQ